MFVCTCSSFSFASILFFFFFFVLFFFFFLFFFNDPATTEIYTLSLHDALPIYSQYLSTSSRSSASWVHFQESGCQRDDEDTVTEFLTAFEAFVRAIALATPDAVITTETAYSFEAEHLACRDWTNYNIQMRARIASLASDGITVYLAEVDRNIKDLVTSKRVQLGTDPGQQAVWGDAPGADIGRHYTGLGNLMIALSIYDALGYDVDLLDMSLIPGNEVSSADKQLCLDIINSYH